MAICQWSEIFTTGKILETPRWLKETYIVEIVYNNVLESFSLITIWNNI